MLNNVLKLFAADVARLKKYNILQVSLVLALIYATIIYFTSKQEAESLVLMLVFMDVTMMSIIMLGASLFFEKQEGSLKSLMVTPVRFIEVVASKILSIVTLSVITGVILSVVAIVVHSASINIGLLLLYITLAATVHVSLGFVLVIMSKDFNTMLFYYMGYVLIFTLPAILYLANIVPSSLEFMLYLSPSYASQVLLQTAVNIVPNVWAHLFSIFYLITISVCVYRFYVIKKLKEYIMRG